MNYDKFNVYNSSIAEGKQLFNSPKAKLKSQRKEFKASWPLTLQN